MAASHQWYKAVGSGYDVLLHVQAQPPMFEEHQFAAYVVGSCWKRLEVIQVMPRKLCYASWDQAYQRILKITKGYLKHCVLGLKFQVGFLAT